MPESSKVLNSLDPGIRWDDVVSRKPVFLDRHYLVIIWLRKVLGKHLSFMEHPCHDDIVRAVDIKCDQMSGLVHRRACLSFTTPFQVVEKITLSDITEGLHADPVCVVPEIFQCLVDQPTITLARLIAEF